MRHAEFVATNAHLISVHIECGAPLVGSPGGARNRHEKQDQPNTQKMHSHGLTSELFRHSGRNRQYGPNVHTLDTFQMSAQGTDVAINELASFGPSFPF